MLTCFTQLVKTPTNGFGCGERSGDHQIIRIHPLGPVDICTKFHGYLYDNQKCQPHGITKISMTIQLTDRPTLASIKLYHYAQDKPRSNSKPPVALLYSYSYCDTQAV